MHLLCAHHCYTALREKSSFALLFVIALLRLCNLMEYINFEFINYLLRSWHMLGNFSIGDTVVKIALKNPNLIKIILKAIKINK